MKGWGGSMFLSLARSSISLLFPSRYSLGEWVSFQRLASALCIPLPQKEERVAGSSVRSYVSILLTLRQLSPHKCGLYFSPQTWPFFVSEIWCCLCLAGWWAAFYFHWSMRHYTSLNLCKPNQIKCLPLLAQIQIHNGCTVTRVQMMSVFIYHSALIKHRVV